ERSFQLITELWIYAVVINVLAYFTMGIDKKRAQNHQYRISERTLWVLAWIGGATGAFAGMKKFRHKTKHFAFKWGFPALMIIQLVLVGYVIILS
ncbi:DUF1294 domain-containing protein, partial [Peribacillus psychrosaccharolyticus]|uniref:DUF1294 domain-containing protein n=1 Tax=Peribacillus psychrosaccharolyticus TaxID=1407 RepID=UPI002E1D36FC